MSTERTGGVLVFHCDECPEVYEGESNDFGETWASAKTAGWRSFKVDTEWCHACPACVEIFAAKQR